MILLDAYALVALLENEPASAEVGSLLRGPECAITSVNLGEALDVVGRRRRVSVAELHRFVDPLTASVLPVLPIDAADGWRAADIRIRHYRRRTDELSLADCVLLACASPEADTIATSDRPLIRAARAEGVAVIALQNTDGRRPT